MAFCSIAAISFPRDIRTALSLHFTDRQTARPTRRPDTSSALCHSKMENPQGNGKCSLMDFPASIRLSIRVMQCSDLWASLRDPTGHCILLIRERVRYGESCTKVIETPLVVDNLLQWRPANLCLISGHLTRSTTTCNAM